MGSSANAKNLFPEPTIPKEPTTNPIQYTETPVTINLVPPDKVTGKENTESENPIVLGSQVEIQPAAQAKTPEVVVVCVRKWWLALLRKVYANPTIKRRSQSNACLNQCQ